MALVRALTLAALPGYKEQVVDESLAGKVAVVTGSSRGIGRAIVMKLAAAGCSVVINYRQSEEEAREAAAAIEAGRKGASLVVRADVSREDEVESLFQATEARFGRLDILVNNAAIAGRRPFLEIDPPAWRGMLENDLTSVYLCCRAALPRMLKTGWGRIVNIASTSGMTGGTSGVHYAAAKGGVIALTKALGREFASRGVTVNAVVPSKIETDQLWSSLGSEEEKKALLQKIPVKRFGTPEEIAGLVLYLVSESAGYITGETIVASGGY